MKFANLLIGIAGLAFAAQVGAVSWDTASPPSINPTPASIYCSQIDPVTHVSTCNTSGGLSGSVIKMTAYSTQVVNPTGNDNTPPTTSSPDDSGTWVAAQIAMYSGGIGITNTKQTSATETGSPQHAIDNRGVNDILVIDFGSDNWDVSSFSLGWTCVIPQLADSATDSCPTTGGAVNADAWLGGTGAIDFTSVSFNGSGVPVAPSGFGTFTQLVLNPDTGGVGTRNNNLGTSTAEGRYLIIAGGLSGYSDAFKVSGIDATQNQQIPPSQAPAPGSMPLVALGLLALTWVSSRRRLTAGR